MENFNEFVSETFEDEIKTEEVVEIKDYNDLYSISVENLIKWLDSRFYYAIPKGLESIDDMKAAGKLLGQLSNDYSYLN